MGESFTVVYDKTYNSILSDIDYWLIYRLGKRVEDGERIKLEFAKDCIGKPASAQAVAELAYKHFQLGVLTGRPKTDFVKSDLKVDNSSQKLTLSLDYENILKVVNI